MDTQTLMVFAPVALFFLFAVLVVVLTADGSKSERAISIIKGKKQYGFSENDFDPDTMRNKDELARKLKERDDVQSGKSESYRVLLERAGLSIDVGRFFMFSGVLGVLVAFIFLIMKFSPLMCGLMGIIFGLGLPRVFLKFMAKRRQKKFLESMADVLESMVRMLKAGMPVSEAISMVSREFTGPVGEEMTLIFEEQKLGTPLPEAMARAAVRMPITEMKMLATAITIQQQTGAALSEVLQNLAALLRARFQLKRKIVALSAEAKYTSIIIGSLPVLVTGGLYVINPDYIGLLFTDNFGRVLLIGAVVWMSIGIAIMKKMVNFRV